MSTKTIIALISGAVFLMGCSDVSHYPISGQNVSDHDSVRFMSAPEITRF